MKSVRIRSFCGPYFPAYGLNTERYCIHSECGKIQIRKTPNTYTFHAVVISYFSVIYYSKVIVKCKYHSSLIFLQVPKNWATLTKMKEFQQQMNHYYKPSKNFGALAKVY